MLIFRSFSCANCMQSKRRTQRIFCYAGRVGFLARFCCFCCCCCGQHISIYNKIAAARLMKGEKSAQRKRESEKGNEKRQTYCKMKNKAKQIDECRPVTLTRESVCATVCVCLFGCATELKCQRFKAKALCTLHTLLYTLIHRHISTYTHTLIKAATASHKFQ